MAKLTVAPETALELEVWLNDLSSNERKVLSFIKRTVEQLVGRKLRWRTKITCNDYGFPIAIAVQAFDSERCVTIDRLNDFVFTGIYLPIDTVDSFLNALSELIEIVRRNLQMV